MVFECNIFPLFQALEGSVVECVEEMTVFDRVEYRRQARAKWSNDNNNEFKSWLKAESAWVGEGTEMLVGWDQNTKQNWQGMAPGARQNQGVTQGSGAEDRESESAGVCRWLSDCRSGMKWPEHPIKERSVGPWHLGWNEEEQGETQPFRGLYSLQDRII